MCANIFPCQRDGPARQRRHAASLYVKMRLVRTATERTRRRCLPHFARRPAGPLWRTAWSREVFQWQAHSLSIPFLMTFTTSCGIIAPVILPRNKSHATGATRCCGVKERVLLVAEFLSTHLNNCGVGFSLAPSVENFHHEGIAWQRSKAHSQETRLAQCPDRLQVASGESDLWCVTPPSQRGTRLSCPAICCLPEPSAQSFVPP